MKLNGWQAVVVIALVLGAIVTLAALHQETGAVIGLGVLILGGLGLVAGQQFGIKEQTNGNTSKLLAMVEKMADQLAAMHPPKDDEQPPT